MKNSGTKAVMNLNKEAQALKRMNKQTNSKNT